MLEQMLSEIQTFLEMIRTKCQCEQCNPMPFLEFILSSVMGSCHKDKSQHRRVQTDLLVYWQQALFKDQVIVFLKTF